MKKIIALAMAALMMMTTAAFAEEVSTPTNLVSPVEVAETVEAPAEDAEVVEAPAEEITQEVIADEIDVENNREVIITARFEGDTLYYGAEVTLHAQLIGYENCNVSVQWQLNGKDVKDATKCDFTFVASHELDGEWQLIVTEL